MEAHDPIDQTRAAQIPVDAWCIGCGYQLQGLVENRCPECGRGFDPSSRQTFHAKRQTNAFVRWLLRPPGWPTSLAAGAIAATTLLSASMPGSYFGLMVLAATAWQILLVAYALRLGVHGLFMWRMKGRHFSDRKKRLKWLIVPGVLVMVKSAALLQIPQRMTYRISLPAMNRLAQQAATLAPGTKLPDRWIGLYPAYQIETYAGGVRFLVEGSGFMAPCGWAYSASAPPPNIGGEDIYRIWSGNWFHWTESW